MRRFYPTWTLLVGSLLGLATACSCPTNANGESVSANKYAAERDAACAAVEGCTAEGMAEVRVFEVNTQAEVAELCQISNAYACYCFEAIGCQTIFLLQNAHANALHEYVHAALDQIGIDTRSHGELFDRALESAKAQLRAAQRGTDP